MTSPRYRRLVPMAVVLLLALAALPAAAQSLPVFPLPDAYFSFDQCVSGKVMDDTRVWSDTSAHATLYYNATCSSGQYGSAGLFDGVGDYAVTAKDLDYNNAITVAAWVRPDVVNRWQTVVNKWYAPDSWGLFIEPNYYNFTVSLPGGNKSVRYPASTGVWTHVAAVYTGSQLRLYINGSRVQTISASGTINASNRPIAIGGHPSWNAFDGKIDEVKVWGVALNDSQVSQIATPPSSLGVRGVHLYPSQYAVSPYDSNYGWLIRDQSLIQEITNLNSVKSAIFSYREFGGQQYNDFQTWQADKLTRLKAAAGNHVTWVLRAWPTQGDFNQDPSWFNRGYIFAQNLAGVFYHLQYELKLQNVVIEVANEPNIASEGFTNSSGWPDLSYYNDFFRGFYWGERSVGYSLPLAYAGLSPGDYAYDGNGNPLRFNSTVWYQNSNTLSHIQSYASKVGVHIYWIPGQRTSTNEGQYYKNIHDILASGGVSQRGLVITEFNTRRDQQGSAQNQINDVCNWWKEEAIAASQGWWVEQAMLYISHADGADDQAWYELQDSQIDDVRTCQ